MKKLVLFPMLLLVLCARGQNDRLYDHNNINWLQVFGTKNLANKTDLLAEYQFRRTAGLSRWQQSLLRVGIQTRIDQQVSFAIGYAWIETFPYGDFPIASNGTFPEHRIHEQLQWKQSFAKINLTHRLRIEQRFIGKRRAASEREIEDWLFSHRFRYLARLQVPFVQKERFNLYGAVADEVFISAGKNVGVNIFDQNRLMFFLGSKLSKSFSVEAGYINQTLMQGRRINNRTVMQNNNGLFLATYLNF